MTDIHQKKEEAHTATISPIVAGIAGVVAGGVAVAAAVAMSDKKNQKKVKDALTDAKEKVVDYAETIQSQPIIKKSVLKLEEEVKNLKQQIKTAI